MNTWVVIAAADLDDYLVAAQMTALRSSALADGQADPFTNVMHDRANYVRNRISSRIDISATAYAVPPELKSDTCWLIIEAMQARLPSLKLSDDQKNLVTRAYKDLDIAGTEDFPISNPADPTAPDVNVGAAIEQASSITRKTSRDKLDGL